MSTNRSASFTIDGNLFRVVAGFVSTEKGRYYLQGVHVEPHPVSGAILVATDGHRMICAHDPSGFTPHPVIVQLNAAALKQCKPGRGSHGTRVVIPLQSSALETLKANPTATVYECAPDGKTALTDDPLTVSPRCLIDGTFPDWRRIVPAFTAADARGADWFNGRYLGDFGRVPRELFGEREAMTIASREVGAPALIRWSGIANVFGLIRPMRGDSVPGDLPEWFHARPDYASRPVTAAEQAPAPGVAA